MGARTKTPCPTAGGLDCEGECAWPFGRRPLLKIAMILQDNRVLQTRSYHSADCDADHSPVTSIKGRPRINTCGTLDPGRQGTELRRQPPGETWATRTRKWSHFPDAIYDSAMTRHLGKKNADYFAAHWMKWSQSRWPRGKRCWLTSRTLAQAHPTLSEQLGARPSRRRAIPQLTPAPCHSRIGLHSQPLPLRDEDATDFWFQGIGGCICRLKCC